MSKEEKPKKRVGTWREYIAYLSKRGTLSSVGISLLLGCFFIVLLIILGISTSCWEIIRDPIFVHILGTIIRLIVWCIIWGGSLMGVALLCKKSLKSATAIPAVAPPTRQNTASIPALDVLVRASAEPTEEAGKILLRATVTDVEMPVEELLRPR